MKFNEKLIYKIRNYLYDIDRKQVNKKIDPSIQVKKEESKGENILSFFDEMEEYLEQEIQSKKNKSIK